MKCLVARDRHAGGESIEFANADLGRSWVAQSVGIGYSLRRITSSGMSQTLHGKGEIHCPTQRIYVWSMALGEFSTPCPKPQPSGHEAGLVACSRIGRTPAAQEITADFRVEKAGVSLPRRCRPALVEARVRNLLRAFNLGAANAVARSFTLQAVFEPYTATPGLAVRGRAGIKAFARNRYAVGDGWTASNLQPPLGAVGVPREAVYGAGLEVRQRGSFVAASGAKIVLDCRTGLIRRWDGPGIAAPP